MCLNTRKLSLPMTDNSVATRIASSFLSRLTATLKLGLEKRPIVREVPLHVHRCWSREVARGHHIILLNPRFTEPSRLCSFLYCILDVQGCVFRRMGRSRNSQRLSFSTRDIRTSDTMFHQHAILEHKTTTLINANLCIHDGCWLMSDTVTMQREVTETSHGLGQDLMHVHNLSTWQWLPWTAVLA